MLSSFDREHAERGEKVFLFPDIVAMVTPLNCDPLILLCLPYGLPHNKTN